MSQAKKSSRMFLIDFFFFSPPFSFLLFQCPFSPDILDFTSSQTPKSQHIAIYYSYGMKKKKTRKDRKKTLLHINSKDIKQLIPSQ